jgi:hypothetical protein
MPLTSKQIDSNPDIYISFSSSISTQCEQLFEILKSNQYKNVFIWNGKDRIEKTKIKLLINNAKVFICCVTENYLKSFNCKFEINYAHSIGKPILALIIDKNVLKIQNKESDSIGKILFNEY